MPITNHCTATMGESGLGGKAISTSLADEKRVWTSIKKLEQLPLVNFLQRTR